MTKRLLVATRKGLFDIQQQDSGQWQLVNKSFLGEPVTMVLRDNHDQTLYAALNLGHFGPKLHRSDDDGANWEEVNMPSYKKVGSDGENNNEENSGEENDEPKKGPSVKQIWSMETGAPGTLWAGTIPGGLFKSTDRGESWELIQSLWNDPLREQWFGGGYDEPGIHSICVDPRDSNRIVVGISCGGVWLSEDNGNSWCTACEGLYADYMPPEQRANPATQDPHRLVQCQIAPDHFWIQHHNGIFRSIDGCQQWTDVTAQPSSFGFAVAVHPHNPDIAWFVPAIKDEKRYPVEGKFVVSKTLDGGKSFSIFNNGLPQDESYDLVYRHALDVDNSGNYLALASTTGNMWISENGGDHWQLFSNYLPPVYCVRFVNS